MDMKQVKKLLNCFNIMNRLNQLFVLVLHIKDKKISKKVCNMAWNIFLKSQLINKN